MTVRHERAPRASQTIFKCPHCRSEYELVMGHLSFRQRSYANCQICSKTMYSWNSSHVPCFTLVKRSDGET
jgi:transcription elongation factor Elf1